MSARDMEHRDTTQEEDTLTVAQHRGVVALLTEPTLQDAAKSTGVNRSTLYKWLQEPDFQAAYRDARRQAVHRATVRLQGTSSEGVEGLREVMGDKAQQGAARVGAARLVLDFAARMTETEDLERRVEERLAAIEGQKH